MNNHYQNAAKTAQLNSSTATTPKPVGVSSIEIALTSYFKNLKEWNSSQPDYIKELVSYIEVAPEKQTILYNEIKRHLVSTIACALHENIINSTCFVFFGESLERINKFISFLCPDALKVHFQDGFLFEPNKNTTALTDNFIINIGDIGSYTTAELYQVERLFTFSAITERRPHAAAADRVIRRASFFAATNNGNFLKDSTLSNNFIVFPVTGIHSDYAKMDISNVWAQAHRLYLQQILGL